MSDISVSPHSGREKLFKPAGTNRLLTARQVRKILNQKPNKNSKASLKNDSDYDSVKEEGNKRKEKSTPISIHREEGLAKVKYTTKLGNILLN